MFEKILRIECFLALPVNIMLKSTFCYSFRWSGDILNKWMDIV